MKMKALSFSARLPVVMYWRLPLKSAKPSVRSSTHAQEAGRAAAVLHVGLAAGAGGGEIERAHLAQEGGQVRRDGRLPAAFCLSLGVAGTGAALFLDGLDGGREGDVAGGACHGESIGWRARTIAPAGREAA